MTYCDADGEGCGTGPFTGPVGGTMCTGGGSCGAGADDGPLELASDAGGELCTVFEGVGAAGTLDAAGVDGAPAVLVGVGVLVSVTCGTSVDWSTLWTITCAGCCDSALTAPVTPAAINAPPTRIAPPVAATTRRTFTPGS